MSARRDGRAAGHAGFSLIELLAVVAIIAIISAVAMPAIARYIRNYRIRGAMQQVASEINAARTKAIMKNVNLGVVFLVVSPTTFRWVIEDRQIAGTDPAVRDQVSTILATPALAAEQVGPLQTLPLRVQFGTTCTGFAASNRGVRFNRLGGWCPPGAPGTACPALDTGAVLLEVPTAGNTARVCLVEIETNMQRILTLSAAGRVVEQQ
jgi:prepilin-type N-terminal cleavage/methylation domain-containing protein